ncbi:hypothetical protein M231_07455 [Tremella mesenterica]|uniref:ATP-dependent DNA helicase II subunit 2 n=1 Tax=Tremella mesenterica TaxID=5217 RepID=A0A4Q1BC75_TREME|nr:uncharacterized protein TREMEDRAFT_71662 [Tremella mesenterica DSM 1558]EIW69540.1 hypothetical protein TREMEDRAFT_71662 [Tremella mesenterica DSM 1558]RXK35284.1 hypothetical protein M231_07455 [Tremella mesenterica]
MPADRAGYTLSLFAIDVSPSMGGEVVDPESFKKTTKLALAQEYVARRCVPKISSGRKTEAVGLLSFGGKTNNQAHNDYTAKNPEDDDPMYAHVACDVAIQTARPKIVETVMNVEVGEHEGNPISALMVALDMIQVHKHTKSWALEVILITDGESNFDQGEYEDAMDRFDDMGVQLNVLGIGFDPLTSPVDKTKSRAKRLSEKFWRIFIEKLHERISSTTSSEEILPTIGLFEEALAEARMPRPTTVNSAVSPIDLKIGSPDVDPEQAIIIPIKYSKATMKARPPSLSKAWKPAMDLQVPMYNNVYQSGPSQLVSSFQASQGSKIDPTELAGMISADVKAHSTYVVKRQEPPAGTQVQPSHETRAQGEGDVAQLEDGHEEEMVAKEDIVKAWKFGSTWVPMEADTFEPLNTTKGVEILGFFPREAIKRHLLMGEVRFIWPDLTSPKAQLQFSSLVEGMYLREMCAVVRWVLKDQSDPIIGACVPEFNYPGEDKRLDYMFWCQLPFAEDEHNFWFPSLTDYKTSSGKVITEHPLIPTQDQCDLMDDFVQSMDLDIYARSLAKTSTLNAGEEGDEKPDLDVEVVPWFEPARAFNPAIHRIKEAIFHASLTQDLEKDPLGPPHPELVKYFDPPEEPIHASAKITTKLKEVLAVKKVPPRQRKKVVKEGLREEEGYIDIDELFDDPSLSQKPKVEPATPQKLKPEPISPLQLKAKHNESQNQEPSPRSQPKKGRLVSNQTPLEDFNALIEGEGDVFRKAIQDLGEVVKENVTASFSRSAFPLALECLKAIRQTALTYEEVDTYNEYIEELEEYVKAPGFKHKDFWEHFEKEGKEVSKISPEEAKAALEGYD